MLRRIDDMLNGITMYRVVLHGLRAMAAYAIACGFLGFLSYGGWQLLISLLVVTTVCWAVNWICAKLWNVPANAESWIITSLILFFLFAPASTASEAYVIAAAAAIAMASKYVFAIRGKHLFNPAALAAVVLGYTGLVFWWIGTPVMLPIAVIVGLLIVRKIRRFGLFLSCLLVSFATVSVLGIINGQPILDALTQHLLSWPIIFFVSVMVTEPLTTPPRRYQQLLYGAFIGVLSSWPIHVAGPLYVTPELSLLVANLLSYSVSLRRRLLLTLREKRLIARDTYEFVFDVPPPRLAFSPGQYLEWTLPHAHPDSRGVRRYFTVASSPTENEMRLGVKIGQNVSTFKQRLRSLEPGEKMFAGQLGGDFVLPKDPRRKLVFIAGGIGITPFRSMIKSLIDRAESRDLVLFYANKSPEDVAYKPLFDEAAARIGMRTVTIFSGEPGASPSPEGITLIDEQLIRTNVPDVRDRMFYLSGPTGMVDTYKELLRHMGVARTHIVTDYFPGFA